MRNRSRKGRQKAFDELVTEMKGIGNKAMSKLLRLSNKHQQDRQFIIDQTAKGVLTSFENEGKDLTKEQLSSLTRVFLKADLSTLLKGSDIEEIAQLILNPTNLDQKIKKLTQQLSGPNRLYYLGQAKDLGYFLATGKVSSPNLMLNAASIAYMAGTPKVIQGNNQTAANNEPIIDALASLYALKYTPEQVMAQAREITRNEINRSGDNGIITLLKLHQHTQQEAFEASFTNNPYSFMKGYTREQFTPHRSLIIADAKDVLDFQTKGYKPAGELEIDPADPTRIKNGKINRRVLMYIDKGIQPYTTGMMSYSGKRVRGTTLHDGLHSATGDTFYVGNALINQQVVGIKKPAINYLFNRSINYDPAKSGNNNYMVPVLGKAGVPVDYRYLMNEETKDTILQRNNRVDDVLGAMAGATFDKQNTAILNQEVIQALKEEYDSSFVGNSEAYITFGPNSTDKVIQENYAMLPDDTKKVIKQIWGTSDIKVRADQYNLIFGYRKYSLGDIWNKPHQERNITEKVFFHVIGAFLGAKAELRVRQAENAWKELVLMTKDIIVIKNLFTLMGNISANVTLLLWQGVSPTTIYRNHVTAIKGITSYHRDHREIFHINQMIKSGLLGNHTLQELEQRKIELEDLLENNPVKELVDEGMLQTIIDDVARSDDKFSYQTQLEEKLSENTQWLPEVIKKTGKTLLVAHDTPLYALLSKSTAMSDFVARYTLHQHLTTRIKEPLSKKESFEIISEAFINYDIPAGKSMEYLNDVGLFWFTRYFLRIQKVLFRMFKENPARGIALAFFGNLFPNIPTLMESNIVSNLGNPLGNGAFALPETVDELITLKAAAAVF